MARIYLRRYRVEVSYPANDDLDALHRGRIIDDFFAQSLGDLPEECTVSLHVLKTKDPRPDPGEGSPEGDEGLAEDE
jgi:hypothetical protein